MPYTINKASSDYDICKLMSFLIYKEKVSQCFTSGSRYNKSNLCAKIKFIQVLSSNTLIYRYICNTLSTNNEILLKSLEKCDFLIIMLIIHTDNHKQFSLRILLYSFTKEATQADSNLDLINIEYKAQCPCFILPV